MISLNWVKDYIDIENENLEELATKITKAGINIEAIVKSRIDNLVIGEIIECIEHPDSDHLHVCKVDVGNEVIQIVCGASNARKGIKVLVALPGCKLPGDFIIKAGKIRGIESNGMMCALYELGLEKKTEETYAKGIAELSTDLANGTDANIYLNTDDTMYELDVHKHRNNDCYYHIGFAYEIACILNKKVTLPSCSYSYISDNISNYMNLKVDTNKCPFYLGKMVKDVVIKESPDFIKKRLISAGMRPINNVVDISNYVMLEFGQPLHFFDKDKLGDTILVRDAYASENIITLDGINRDLTPNDIVITDGVKPVCIAGIMGGENSEVSDETKTIFIESAIFDSTSIRYSASNLNLKSEASIRYGKGLSYEYTKLAIDRACHLLEKYADAKVLDGILVHDKVNKEKKVVSFKTSEVASLLGIELTDDIVKAELDRLDFPFIYENNEFIVTIPSRRLDIENNVNDIAEEIGRLYGYHNLKSKLPKVETRRGVYVGDVKIRKETSFRLRNLGLTEAKTYTLVSPENAKLFNYENKTLINLPNPLTIDKSIIRTSILPSLLNIYDYNKARKIDNILIYEIAKTYDINYNEDLKVAILMKGEYLSNSWNKVNNKVDFYLIKGIVENLLDYLGFKNRYNFSKINISDLHPGISAKISLDRDDIGIIGRVHPSLRKDDIYVCELSLTKLYNKQIKPIKFKEANKYPEIVKDLAFVMDNSISSEEIRMQIKRSGGKLLDSCKEFDVYQDFASNKKSIAYKLVFKDTTKTLLEEEVMEVFNKIIKDVEEKTSARLRK